MAKWVDATDLIGLSLGMKTYQVITFKFRETLELTMGNPEPNPRLNKKIPARGIFSTPSYPERAGAPCVLEPITIFRLTWPTIHGT
ncbi:hypothetical protein Lal_00019936 [Lupinus albus]|nr:hypothetical protein Lal_00019936 [Lupinus albus]